MDQPALDNQTDFVVFPHTLVGTDRHHRVVIVKATFDFIGGTAHPTDGTFAIAPKERRRGIRAADIPWGKPEIPSILFPTDLCLKKPGTEIIVAAFAHAPDGRAVPSFDAGVRVGRASKTVRVVGPRVWASKGESVTSPAPLRSLAVRYDFAFGGTDISEKEGFLEDPRNPVGVGIKHDPGSLEGQPAPQLEDPSAPVKNAHDKPKPGGLGPIGRSFEPRRRLFGTYDQAWVDDRAPLLPRDFDDRSNFSAPAELVATPPFAGGEEGALINLTVGGGSIGFVLPRVALEIGFVKKGGNAELMTPYLDTVVIDTRPLRDPDLPVHPNLFTIELVWRASIPEPAKAKDLSIVVRERKKGR